jgi:hypothetical protein
LARMSGAEKCSRVYQHGIAASAAYPGLILVNQPLHEESRRSTGRLECCCMNPYSSPYAQQQKKAHTQHSALGLQ